MVPAGAYTLYMVPDENGGKLASANVGRLGVPVDEKNDLSRVDLKKEPLEKPTSNSDWRSKRIRPEVA